MPKIDFYILPDETVEARLKFACRLIEKAHKHNHRIYIHASHQKEAHQLDELLWTYREDSFLPHNLYGEGPELAPPIQIGWDQTPEKHRDILINLSETLPHFYEKFQRVLELVINTPAAQEAARERYRLYRTKQFDIQTHKCAKESLQG